MLEVTNIYKSYHKGGFFSLKGRQEVLQGISFSVKAGECVGLIGESGSGKSTLSRLVLGLEKPDKGEVKVEGDGIATWRKKYPGQMSAVFQDYNTSANPRFTIEDIIREPLFTLQRKTELRALILELMDKVGLSAKLLTRYPHELSGGQLQRVCLARAISTRPRLMVLDEALSSLDVSIQVQILELLRDLKRDLHLTYLFIAHDLQTITYLCDQVLFLYQGKIVEQLPKGELSNAKNEYAKRLLTSVITFGGHDQRAVYQINESKSDRR